MTIHGTSQQNIREPIKEGIDDYLNRTRFFKIFTYITSSFLLLIAIGTFCIAALQWQQKDDRNMLFQTVNNQSITIDSLSAELNTLKIKFTLFLQKEKDTTSMGN